jgi:hypothetical protein
MTISTTTVEASLQTALDATTGTTEAKELLLLGKAAEAITTVGSSLTSILTTQGDVLYRNATGPVRLAAGAAGEVLKSGGAGANPTWGAASGAADFELASNMTARQVAQIDSTGKVGGITQTTPISPSVMLTTPWPNTSGITNAGTHYMCAVDPSNPNRFAMIVGDGTSQINVGIVATNGQVTWSAKLPAGQGPNGSGQMAVEWDPVNAGVLWSRSGYGSSAINRFSVPTNGVTMTHLGQITISDSTYNYGDLSLHPTISGRFIVTNRSSGNLELWDLTSNTAATLVTSQNLGTQNSNHDFARFFLDDGTKFLVVYGAAAGGIYVRVGKLVVDAITLGTAVHIGTEGGNLFRGKSFTWEPTFNSTTGARFAVMSQFLHSGGTGLAVGTVTNAGDGTVTVGTPILLSSQTVDGVALPINLSDHDTMQNVCFNPYNTTQLMVNYSTHTGGGIFDCSLVGNEITIGTTAVSVGISGNSITGSNGVYTSMVNLGSTGRFVSLMEGTGSAIVNQHYKAAVSNLDADKVMGFVTAAGSTGDTKTVQYSGQIGGFSGLTIGAKHYAQEDASVTSTKVSTSVPVGVAVNATTLQVRL